MVNVSCIRKTSFKKLVQSRGPEIQSGIALIQHFVQEGPGVHQAYYAITCTRTYTTRAYTYLSYHAWNVILGFYPISKAAYYLARKHIAMNFIQNPRTERKGEVGLLKFSLAFDMNSPLFFQFPI